MKEVVEAVRAIYDLSTPNERRLMFSREIEDLKERLSPPSAISLAFQLAQHPLPMVKHLGWNMVEHVIRYLMLRGAGHRDCGSMSCAPSTNLPICPGASGL